MAQFEQSTSDINKNTLYFPSLHLVNNQKRIFAFWYKHCGLALYLLLAILTVYSLNVLLMLQVSNATVNNVFIGLFGILLRFIFIIGE